MLCILEKTLVQKEKFQYFKKISLKISKVLTESPAKISQNIFAYFSVSEHSAPFLFEKKTYFGCGKGVAPPPFLRTSPQLIGFFDVFLKMLSLSYNKYKNTL